VRLFSYTILLSCLLLVSSPRLFAQENERPGEEEETIRVETNLVSIPVSVRDRKGRFITNLRQDDFKIFENGVQQEIRHFAPIEQPFSVVLLIDTSGSTKLRMKEIQEAAIAFVEQLRPADRVLPIAFDNEVVALLQDWTSDRATLRAAIERARTGLMAKSSGQVVRDRGKTYNVVYISTRLYDAMLVAHQLFKPVEGRKAIILFSDGVDSNSRVATLKSTLQQAEEGDAVIYSLQFCQSCDVWDPRSKTPQSQLIAKNYLEDLAKRTGGHFYRADNLKKIAQAFTAIAEELRRLYSLGYYPSTDHTPGAARQVSVKVNRRDLVVRERKTFMLKSASKQTDSNK